jgi:HEAT repeat protein
LKVGNFLSGVLKVRPGETRLVILLSGAMLLAAAGSSLGSSGIDALFFARYGVSQLPLWYAVLGLATFLNLIFIAGLTGNIPVARLYQALPVVLTALLILGRVLLATQARWTYPLLFVGKEVIIAIQGVFLWGLAGIILDARQAKRLFPLFMAGSIAGSMLGAFATPLAVRITSAENLLITWGLAMAGTSLACFALVRTPFGGRPALSSTGKATRHQAEGKGVAALFNEMREGAHYMRRSSLVGWLSVASLLFSVLWFSLLLPFSRFAASQFPDPNQLAGFLGLFQGIWTGVALFVSLFTASRLLARFGLTGILEAYNWIYLAAFGALLVFPIFPVIVAFRSVKLVWSQSLAEPAWQMFFNAIPAARREQARVFINAVPGQAGIVLSGLILLIGDEILKPQQLYWIGLVTAGVCIAAVWRMKKAYLTALTESLRSGQPQVFFSEEEPFGGYRRDPAVLKILRSGLSDADVSLRRLSAEVLGQLPVEEAVTALQDCLSDPHPEVRTAGLVSLRQIFALPALALNRATVLEAVTACLGDAQAEVRCQALQTYQLLADDDPAGMLLLRSLLADPDPEVRIHAARSLYAAQQDTTALDILVGLAASVGETTRGQALRAIGECLPETVDPSPDIILLLSAGLDDPSPVVRCDVLEGISVPPPALLDRLVVSLGDTDPDVRTGAAAALSKLGEAALPALLRALEDASLEPGALVALENLPTLEVREQILGYITHKVAEAIKHYDWSRAVHRDHNQTLLADTLGRYAFRQAFLALQAYGLISDRQSACLIRDALRSQDPIQSAYALEMLEAPGDAALIRPLLRLWEREESAEKNPALPLHKILDSPDSWLRACAAFAARDLADPDIEARLANLAQSDPDQLVRQTAILALTGGNSMDTLATLAVMERILFLRQVPLFADLPPEDLKQVAAIGMERYYTDEEVITRQGTAGDELYIIISGQVRVMSDNGRQLALRKQGEYVGEMALLTQSPRMASLVAAGDTRLLCLAQKEFEAILRQRPEICLAVIRVLCDRIRQYSQ